MTMRFGIQTVAILAMLLLVCGVLVVLGIQNVDRPDLLTLQEPTINVGDKCGYPTQSEPCISGSKAKGLRTGHIAIGNNTHGTDAYIGIWGDEIYENPNQEMRGLSYALRTTRSAPDEQSLGWDVIPIVAASVIEASNNQKIVGNVKSLVAETHFVAPSVGTYRVRNSYNFQSTLVTLGRGVTLEHWQGLIVSPTPTGGGTIGKGYGVEIGAVTAETAAALKLDGDGDAGRILWTNWGIAEKDDTNLHFQLGANDVLKLTPTSAEFSRPIIATLENAGQSNVVCYNSSSGKFTYRSWATGCTPSSLRFKKYAETIQSAQALDIVVGLQPKRYRFKESIGMDHRSHIGFLAEEVAAKSPELVEYEADGTTPRAVKYQEIIPLLVGAVRDLKAANDNLQQEIERLKRSDR